MMEYVRERGGTASRVAPIPAKWSFSQPKKKIQLSTHSDDLARFGLCYGFIGGIADSSTMDDTCAPISLQVIVKLPFRFGETAKGKEDSFLFARVNAFSSMACLGRSFESLCLGMPVRGVLELTRGTYESAQLVG